jgi:bifunctional DNA-binding transcriptional regulator/antitoxin component of YhaV-PrlF toxin-antitoxin module
MSIIELRVKEKGRTVLPVELQKACGFKPGDILVVEEFSDGRFLVETKERKIESIWEKALTSEASPSTQELLRGRAKDEVARLERLSNPKFVSEKESAKRGASLLALVQGK